VLLLLLLLRAAVAAGGTAGLAVGLAGVTTSVAGHLIPVASKKVARGWPWVSHRVATMTTAPASRPLRILLLDTETNGLPKNRFAPPSQWDAYPAILQLSWSVFVVEGRTMRSESKRDIGIALHPSIPWDTGAAAIHGISEAEARRGTPAAEALLELAGALRGVHVVVAHNLSFDKPVIRAAAYAEADRGGPTGLRSVWPAGLGEFCTMRELRNIVRIPSPSPEAREPFKVPKLSELYGWLYGHAFDISGGYLHSARADTFCLASCMTALLRRGIVQVSEGRLITVPPEAE
jgi:DNA polymerase III epsilon subunit-like protein